MYEYSLLEDELPILFEYIEGVKDGSIVTGNLMKQSVERFLEFLKRPDLIFKPFQVEKVIVFSSNLKHFTGRFAGKPFILSPWQVFIISHLYGLYYKETNLRVFSELFIEVARKNGKTLMCSMLSLYELLVGGEENAQIYFAANSKSQAAIGFEATQRFSTQLDPRQRTIRAYRNEVKFDGSQIKVVASDASKLDGLNCSSVILDEGHEARTDLVYNVLKSSQGSRESPIFINISTAGFNKYLPFYEQRLVAIDVLKGNKVDDTLAVFIFELDEDDDWKDEKNWQKANPGLNISVKSSYIKSEINKAINNVSLESDVKTKHLNIWCDVVTTWIPSEIVLANSHKLDMKDFLGEPCWGGIDLSSTMDLTSMSFVFKRNEKFYAFFKNYLPESSANTNQDKEFYKNWNRQSNINGKYLNFTPGNVCDYQYVLKDLIEISQQYDIQSVGYDSWNADMFVIMAQEAGVWQLEEFSQRLGSFNKCTKNFERLMLSNRFQIEDNPVVRWALANCVIFPDRNGNIKPSKEHRGSIRKIDSIIAMLMALGMHIKSPSYEVDIF